jgi:RNA polymerase sigma factor (sigma-70 family)
MRKNVYVPMEQKPSYQDESNLLQDFISGNEKALKIMYDLFYLALWYFANKIIQDEEQAKDYVSEGFMKAWEKRKDFKSLSGIKGFLYTVIRNRCYTHTTTLKSRRRSAKEILFLHNQNDNCFITEQIRAELINHTLMESEKMPPQMKKIFQMIFVEGLSQQETADTLGLSVFTVRTQKSNALKRLKTALKKKGLLQVIFLS